MKVLAAFSLLCLAVTAPAAEQNPVVWEPAKLLDAEQVIASGPLELKSVLTPLAIPMHFGNFRYPFLQPDGSVIFIANDKKDSGKEGIYRISAGGELLAIAEEGDSFAGESGKIAWFAGLRVDGGRAVFRCGLDDGRAGIGMWENDSLVLLAWTGGETGFEELGYPGLSDQAVTFLAHRAGEVGELYAVDLSAFPRTPRKIADTSIAIPGNGGKFFGSFGFQQDADGEDAVFRGFDVGARELLQQTGSGSRALGGVYRKNIRSAGPPVKVLDTTVSLPGDPAGATFAELQNAIPRDGTVVVPSWSKERNGIYYIGRDGKPQLVADTSTQIPDLFDGPFTGFNKWAANCAPWVIFRGYASGHYQGLFAMNMERNELFLLLDTRSELDGKQVAGFELSCRPKLDEDVVLAIEFADGTSGVYLLRFGDGWGQAVFHQKTESHENPETVPIASDRAGFEFSGSGDLAVQRDISLVADAAEPTVTSELLEEGSFRMVGHGEVYDVPEAATGKANNFAEAELLQRADTFPARKGLNFGYRYILRSTGEDLCHAEGFDMMITHPPIKGPDGQERTVSIVPLDVCFHDGEADGFLVYSLEEDHEVLPGQWTLQVRKDGEVLISRSFTLL